MFTMTLVVPSLAAAGTNLVAHLMPEEARLVKATAFIGTANCAGAGAAASIALKFGAGAGAVLATPPTVHLTNDAQELEFTVPKTTAQNVAAGARIIASATAAGGDAAVLSDITFLLTFERPLNP